MKKPGRRRRYTNAPPMHQWTDWDRRTYDALTTAYGRTRFCLRCGLRMYQGGIHRYIGYWTIPNTFYYINGWQRFNRLPHVCAPLEPPIGA
ncbi:MAG TPA: hypothetical protein VLJ17_24675 [Xanthobacteraceae bacterium]|nr:hypothetical protein [Xanthobacteraceae bacterium]